MVVHHAGGLHVGIHDGGAGEFEAPLFQIFGECVRFFGSGRHLVHGCKGVDLLAAVHKLPGILVEGAEFGLDVQKDPGVVHCGIDLELVADNGRVLQQFRNGFRCEPGHLQGIKPGKRVSVAFSAFQYGEPGQSGLGPFQNQELKQFLVIMHRHTPFCIMVVDIHRIFQAPVAALHNSSLYRDLSRKNLHFGAGYHKTGSGETGEAVFQHKNREAYWTGMTVQMLLTLFLGEETFVLPSPFLVLATQNPLIPSGR